MENFKEHLNPTGLFNNPAFSQVVTTQGHGKTIYIGGQNAVNNEAEIVGKHDLAAQTEQALKNIEIALNACNANFSHLVKLNIFIVQGQDLRQGFEASRKYLGHVTLPPIVTVLFVAGLVNPDYLVEIEAIAFVPKAS